MPTDNVVQQYQRRMAIFGAIRRERQYQDRKYGTIEDRNLSIAEYMEIIEAELAEAAEAPSDDEALLELLQVASVVVAALEAHGLVERSQPPAPNP